MAQEGVEPSASLVLSESGLPIAYRAGRDLNPGATTQRGSRTHRRPGLSRAARPLAYLGDSQRKPWDSTPRAAPGRHLFSRQAPHPAGWLPSSGGWNRTSGLRVQSAASLQAATAPEFGKEDSNLHPVIQSQETYRLDDPRQPPAGVDPASRTWEARA